MKKLFSLLLVMLALIACTAPGALAALQDDASCAHHLHSADCGGLASGGGVCSFVCEACRDMLQSMVNALPKASLINESNWRDAAMLLSAIDAARLQVTSGTSSAVNWNAYEDAALACELMQDDTLNELARIAITKSMRSAAGGTCTPSFAFVDEYGMPAEVSLDNCLTASSSPFPVSVGEMVILHVRPGTYTIEEYVDGNYTMTATLNGEPAENNRITLAAGGDYRLSIVNSYIPSSLTVRNTVVSDLAADKDQDFEFTVTLSDTTINETFDEMTFYNGVATFTLKDGESKTAKDLPSNLEYTVTQTAADGFTTTASNNSGYIGRDTTAEFTNTRETGSLAVRNNVVSDLAADKDQAFGFTVTLSDITINGTYGGMTFTDGVATFTLKAGKSATAQGLPTSLTYTVKQTDVIGFTTTKSGYTGTITEDAAEADFTNTRETGSFSVSNTVVSDLAADKDQGFEFTVTLGDTAIDGTYGDMTFTNGVAAFTLKDRESKTAEGLPVGLAYTVTQDTVDGFTTETSNASGVIIKRDVTAAFTNTRKTSSLTVSNTVVSNLDADKEKAFEFTVTFGDTTISGTYGEMTFDLGVAVFTLKDGESKTAEGLPTSLTYTVMQASADDFTTSKSGDTGMITEEDPAAAAFTNTRVLAVTPDHSNTSTIELTTGMSGALSVTAIGGKAPYSYQWYASTGSGFEALADANSPEFRTPAVTMDNNGDQYYCVVTDAAQNSVQSGIFTIQVSNPAQLPKTGDSSRTGLWVTLMLLSASGFLALSRRRSRA